MFAICTFDIRTTRTTHGRTMIGLNMFVTVCTMSRTKDCRTNDCRFGCFSTFRRLKLMKGHLLNTLALLYPEKLKQPNGSQTSPPTFRPPFDPIYKLHLTPHMTSVQLWAPPHLSPSTIAQKVEEWRRANTTRPCFTRFLQDHLDSTWPSFWHLKTPFTIVLRPDSAFGVDLHTDEPICAICRCGLRGGTEKMTCNHDFHTMCIHRWLQYSSTCPVCRAELL